MGYGTRHSSFSFDIMQTNHAVFERPVAGQFQARLLGAVEIRKPCSQQDGVLENPELVYRVQSEEGPHQTGTAENQQIVSRALLIGENLLGVAAKMHIVPVAFPHVA